MGGSDREKKPLYEQQIEEILSNSKDSSLDIKNKAETPSPVTALNLSIKRRFSWIKDTLGDYPIRRAVILGIPLMITIYGFGDGVHALSVMDNKQVQAASECPQPSEDIIERNKGILAARGINYQPATWTNSYREGLLEGDPTLRLPIESLDQALAQSKRCSKYVGDIASSMIPRILFSFVGGLASFAVFSGLYWGDVGKKTAKQKK